MILLGLAAGNYIASISQYSNFAAGTNLSDGFSESDAFFTASDNCTNGQFCDVNADNRTSFWAFDVLGVVSAVTPPPSVVPLPAGLPLLAAGLLGFGALARRKKAT